MHGNRIRDEDGVTCTSQLAPSSTMHSDYIESECTVARNSFIIIVDISMNLNLTSLTIHLDEMNIIIRRINFPIKYAYAYVGMTSSNIFRSNRSFTFHRLKGSSHKHNSLYDIYFLFHSFFFDFYSPIHRLRTYD